MKNKITLKEFFDSNERLVIHCDTEEKANKLLKEFDKLGKEWNNRESYLQRNNFDRYKDKTCYTNYREFCDIEYYKDENIKIYSFEDIIFEEDKPKNLIPEIAKMLGVEIGEEFTVVEREHTKYKLDLESGFMYSDTLGNRWNMAANTLNELFLNLSTIKKLPNKPQLSEQEYWVLKGLKDYKYLTRDIVGDMNVQKNVSENTYDDWDYMCPYNHLFKFVKKDQKPHNIQELMEEYEKLKEQK